MGAAYLLAYITGALLITLGANRLLDDVIANANLEDGLIAFGGGIAVVLAAGVLQAVVVRRRGDAGILDAIPPMQKRGFTIASALWLGPLVWSWAQFEMFWNPVDIYPLISIAGAAGLAFGFGQHLAKMSGFRVPIATVAVALAGVPIGLLSVALPTAHFNYHLTNVRSTTSDPEYGPAKEHHFPAEDPQFHHESTALGDETYELLEAIANAEPVDVEAEIAAGRLERLEDGTLVRIDEQGQKLPVEENAGELDELFERAQAEDARKVQAEQAKARAEFEAELDARRRSGRLFTR